MRKWQYNAKRLICFVYVVVLGFGLGKCMSKAAFALQWKAGTAAGLAALVKFLQHGLPKFDHDRAKIDRESTSKLSPYIHFGEISVCRCPHPLDTIFEKSTKSTHPPSVLAVLLSLCKYVP
jgi:deoxyribodipyrimidine photolyase